MLDPETRQGRLLTFRAGGWVLALTLVCSILVVVITVVPVIRNVRNRAPGDGRDPATYEFALTPSLVSSELLVPAQHHRDVIGALVAPPTIAGEEVETYNRENRGKYLVPNDRVIGVVVDGEARAYPLLVLGLHEVANDTLGGTPIAVTYSPLCDGAVVFDRRVRKPDGGGTDVIEFGVSGLLYNSNLVLYDRQAAVGGESLWSQLERRAITGPAAEAGRRLDSVPAELVHWGDWLDRHPGTTVLAPNTDRMKQYQQTSYATYYLSDEILFPVAANVLAPPGIEDRLPPKAPCAIVFAGDARRCYPMPYISERADATGRFTEELAGSTLTFQYSQDPDAVRVTTGSGDTPASVVYALWFAWHAMDPDIEVAGP